MPRTTRPSESSVSSKPPLPPALLVVEQPDGDVCIAEDPNRAHVPTPSGPTAQDEANASDAEERAEGGLLYIFCGATMEVSSSTSPPCSSTSLVGRRRCRRALHRVTSAAALHTRFRRRCAAPRRCAFAAPPTASALITPHLHPNPLRCVTNNSSARPAAGVQAHAQDAAHRVPLPAL